MARFPKRRMLFSWIAITAMLFVACAGNNNTDNNRGSTDQNVPLTGENTSGELDDRALDDGVVDDGAANGLGAATAEVTAEPDSAAEQAVGSLECAPFRLSNLLDDEITTRDGVDLGEVQAVVVLRAANSMYNFEENMLDDGRMDKLMAAGPLPMDIAAPRVAYLVVDLADDSLESLNLADGDMLLPFSAVNQSVESPNPGAVLKDGPCGLALSLAAADLQTAPLLEDNAWDLTETGWDNDVALFTQQAGLEVPALENNADARAVVFVDGIFDQIDIDVTGLDEEDLGEIEDFILEPQSGIIRYGILETGDVLGLGGERIAIPVSHMLWIRVDDDPAEPGDIFIPVKEDAFQDAPVTGDLDTLDTNDPTWRDEVDSYWNGLDVE